MGWLGALMFDAAAFVLCFALGGGEAHAQVVLAPTGATWTYLDTGVDPGPAWTSVAFDDAAWLSGPAPLGYGEGTEATVVGFGPDPANVYPTTWFRHRFNVANISPFTGLRLRFRRDDGVVVWLNGSELARDNLPAGPIAAGTLATASIDGAVESVWVELAVPDTALIAGDNLLAVELHQAAVDSDDLGFDLSLTATDLTRGPYLNLNTADAVTVKWRTAVATDSVVEIGTAQGALVVGASNPTVSTQHEVRVTGLLPDTLYHYAVGSTAGRIAGDGGGHTLRTAPIAGTGRASRFWVVGDSGTANANAMAVRDAFETWTGAVDPDLFVMLGDNAYSSGTDQQYQTAVFDIYPDLLRRVPVWSTLGNHDGASADSPTMTGPYYDIFTFPRAAEAGGVPSGTEAYYSFDFANVHFVCLDSYDTSRVVGGPMLTWLEADLAATAQDWIVAFWHHPPYSMGSHNSDFESYMVDMRTRAVPILEDHGVDLVLTGHSHSYERSWLIDGHHGLSSTFDPAVHGWDLGDGDELGDGAYAKSPAAPHEGAVYVVAGSSGQISGGTLDHDAMFVGLNSLGSLVLDVDGLRLDAVFLDGAGAERDRFTIVKDEPCPDPDADGVCSNADDCRLAWDPGQTDGDLDGAGDACDPCPGDAFDDLDFDGVCGDVDVCPVLYDPMQLDKDADGEGDPCDPCPEDALDDVDADGWCANLDNCPSDANPTQQDLDADAVGDPCDPCLDVDVDGACEPADNCPFANPTQSDLDGDGAGDACDVCVLDAADDADGDGRCAEIDVCPTVPDPGQADADADGRGDACDPCVLDPYDDIDADGVCGDLDDCPFAPDPLQLDTDGDGVGDACDLCFDVDADGACEPADNCPAANPGQQDRDGDGAGDACDACPDDPFDDLDADGLCAEIDNCPFAVNVAQTDSDGDGLGDACDLCQDPDADGVCDPADNCVGTPNPTQDDTDLDGVGDACEVGCADLDADGVCDAGDNCPGHANATQGDGDGDGTGDPCDPCPVDPLDDLDGDGVCGDSDDCPFAADPLQQDGDGDGLGDACDLCLDVDADVVCDPGDNCEGTANPGQEDRDGDGAGDACDPCPDDPFDDLDGDGLCGEVDGCPFAADPLQQDADGDGLGDACDLCLDADADGACEPGDNCEGTPNPTQDDTDLDGVGDACEVGCADVDADGVCDAVDNCPGGANATQADVDGDGAGDACDPCPADPFDDLDGDGVCGDADDCPFAADPLQQDADGDGLGDACDLCLDDDADSACDPDDNCLGSSNPGQEDRDGDAVGDACDLCPDDPFDDLDGDAWCAEVDNCPFVSNPTQDDGDGDGSGDACEAPVGDRDTGAALKGDGGCGCAGSGRPGAGWVLLVAIALGRRR